MKYYIPNRKNTVALIGLAAIFQVAIAGIVILPSDNTNADDGVDGNIAWDITGDTLTLSVQQGQAGTDMKDYTSVRPLWEGVAGWNNVTKVVIDDSVSTIGNYAFSPNNSLTTVSIGNSVITIGDYAFDTCTSLTSVSFGSGIASIGLGAFENCTSLGLVTIINSGATSIGAGAFYNCSSLTSVTLGNNVTSIGESAFEDCISLTFIAIGNSVTSISAGAFSLTGGRAFYDLNGNELTQDATNLAGKMFIGETQSSLYQVADGGTIGNIIWYIVQNTIYINPIDPTTPTAIPNFSASNRPAWESSSYWADVNTVSIGEGITSTGDYTLYNASNITEITLPSALEIIGGYALSGTSITSVQLPNSITFIGGNSFRGCVALTSITIPASVTRVGGSAFYECSNLVSCIFENIDNITQWGGSTFIRCASLTSIQIPTNSAITTIGDYTFKECTSLTSVTIPQNITSVGSSAFNSCTNLSSVYIMGDVVSIGNYAFQHTDQTLYLPDSTPAALGTDVFLDSAATIYVKDTALSDYQTSWNAYASSIVQVPRVAIIIPPALSISVYGGQTITPTIEVDSRWYSDLTFASSDSSLVSVDNDGYLTAYGTVSSVQITVSVYEWFYEQNATAYTDVNVIYNAESNVDVISGFEYNYTLTPSVTPATIELYGTAASWVSVVDDYTLHGIVPSNIADLNDLVVVQRTTQPDQTYSWHITFTMVDYLEVEIGDNATADVYPNGKVVILGSGQTIADALIPFANLITVVDIRGLTTITDGTLPLCVNPITIILGDSVHTFADTSGNTIEGLVLGKGLTQIPANLTLYNTENVKILDVNNAVGHIFVRSNNNNASLYQVDSTSTRNYYNDGTCYAVVGKSLVNSPKDLLELRFTMLREVPDQIQSFIALSKQSWDVTTPASAGFTDVGVKDGILVGTAQAKTGTYNCSQIHNIKNDQYESEDYLCTLSPLGLEFTIFVEKELIIR